MTAEPGVLGAVLRRQVDEAGDRAFLVCEDDRLSYRELSLRSTMLAKGLLATGVGRGTHVALLLPNGPDFAVAALAIARIGAVVVPLSTLSTAAELRDLLDRADVEVVIAAPVVRGRRLDELLVEAIGARPAPREPAAIRSTAVPTVRQLYFVADSDADSPTAGDRPVGGPVDAVLARATEIDDDLLAAVEADVHPGDPLVIVHTSGSTSAPKGVVHAHGPLLDHLRVLNELRSYRGDDVLFSNSPFFWIGGFAYTFLGTLVAGTTVLCSPQGEPGRVLDMMERERPTMCNGYAASALALAADPTFATRDLSSMRRGNLYALMPESARPADPALRTNMLGMTEGGSVVLSGPDERDLPEQLRGSFGRPTPDLEGRIVDRATGSDCEPGAIGELWLRGAPMMLGYYGVERGDAFDADQWFHTGDLVHRDEHDHWYFHGRGDDMIKSSGANVSPAEVAQAILDATGLEAIVFGLPDPDRGQLVAAAVILPVGQEAGPDAVQLRTYLEPLLSGYKIPRVVRVFATTQVPLRSSGKVDLGRLKELFDAG